MDVEYTSTIPASEEVQKDQESKNDRLTQYTKLENQLKLILRMQGFDKRSFWSYILLFVILYHDDDLNVPKALDSAESSLDYIADHLIQFQEFEYILHQQETQI